jgi:hypothetical protein
MRPSFIPLVVLLLAPLVAAGPATAQPQESQRTQPLDRLLPEIRRNNPGEFLDAERITRDGAPGYRLKMVTPDGRVVSRDVDARTGRAMGGAPDRGPPGGFSSRDENGPPQRGRSNYQNFEDGRGDDARPRLGDRGFPVRDFNQDRQQRLDSQGRFNRPDFGARGDGNSGNRGGRFGGRFGGENAPARGEGRGRGRGQGD